MYWDKKYLPKARLFSWLEQKNKILIIVHSKKKDMQVQEGAYYEPTNNLTNVGAGYITNLDGTQQYQGQS